MTYPKKIKKCPIVDMTCEIRFAVREKTKTIDIVPLLIATALDSENLSKLKKLSRLDLSDELRRSNPDLMYLPEYEYEYEEIDLQLGARIIKISSPLPYIGWKSFKEKIDILVEKLLEINFLTRIESVSIRTINFFEEDILQNLKFSVDTPIKSDMRGYQYNDIYKIGNISIKTTIVNRVSVENTDTHEVRKGSILDIKTNLEKISSNKLVTVMEGLDKLHDTGKEIFFDLLKDSFLKSLEPVYD